MQYRHFKLKYISDTVRLRLYALLQDENDAKLDVMNVSFWQQKNPWQIIFDGYKKGMRPGKQASLAECIS